MKNTFLPQLKTRIDTLLARQDRVLIAIDGNCTAGKSTLADLLAAEYPCNVFRMDDFFLRPEQRTPERFAQPGGNVDYERFRQEVLLPLSRGGSFSYRPFSCRTMTLTQPVEIQPKKLNIIEGTYCLHPYFGAPYDLQIFLSVDPDTQRQRVLRRPEFLADRFFREWIPMEGQYFDAFRIPDRADLRLDTSHTQP